MSSDDDAAHLYMLTAVADTKDDHRVTTYQGTRLYTTVSWIDNPGTNNQLVGVSGNYDAAAGVEILIPRYYYTVGLTRSTEWDFNYVSEYRFERNLRYQNIYGLQFGCHASISIDGKYLLECEVLSSILT